MIDALSNKSEIGERFGPGEQVEVPGAAVSLSSLTLPLPV